MKQALLNWLKENGGKHLEALIIAAALIFAGRMWLQEHDARLQADAAAKTAEVNVKALQSQQVQVQKETQTKVIVLQQKAAAVDTPAKAVAALPTTAPEIQPEVIPDAPERVSVLAQPLFTDINQGQQCKAELEGCQQSLALQKAIDAEKDKEVKAEAKKPGFWHRAGSTLKVSVCAGVGGGAGGAVGGGKGAAIGAVAGALVCQMF